MQKTIIFIAAFLFHTVTYGQLSEVHEDTRLKSSALRVSSAVYNFSERLQAEPSSLSEMVVDQQIPMQADGKIYVQIREGWDTAITIDEEELVSLGLDVHVVYRNTAGIWIDPTALLSVSAQLPQKYLLRFDNQFSADHEGILVTNSLGFQSNGALGQGVKIAVIDIGYSSLSAAQTAGTAPASPTTYDHTGSGNPFESGTPHGTGCTEIIYEYATGATYYLHKISGETQLGTAVNQAITDGVDFISASLSYFNTGWPDGSGVPCAAVKDATDAGIVYFHGIGNFNERHYQSTFFSPDGDNWHEYNLSGDETNEVIIAPGATLNGMLQWTGTPSATNDFDLYFFDESNGSTLASGTLTDDFEEISWTNNTADTVIVEIAINRFNSSNIHFEVFSPSGNDYQFGQTGGSSASPSNSLEDLCITVGAVNQSQYGNTSPNAEPFSSRGPTNNGVIVPDLAAPDGVTLVSYPNGFFGASAGGPNTCGLSAILWSEHTYLIAEGVIEVVKGLASHYNDWGDAGRDNTFGEGGIYLPDFTNNARFIIPEANNTSGLTTLPFLDMEQANDLAPDDTNIFFLGGTHDPPSSVLTTPMVYRSLLENATVKN